MPAQLQFPSFENYLDGEANRRNRNKCAHIKFSPLDATHGLIIRDPWVSMILNGQKELEIRGSNTLRRGRIALIKGGSLSVVGYCDLVDTIGPLTLDQYYNTQDHHKSPMSEIDENGLPYKRTFAWCLENPSKLIEPIKYQHPNGAVIWVKFDEHAVSQRAKRDYANLSQPYGHSSA